MSFLSPYCRVEIPGMKEFYNALINDIDREEALKRFATEYVMLGKECEREGIRDAAIRNYEKALELYPDHPVAKRKIRKLKV